MDCQVLSNKLLSVLEGTISLTWNVTNPCRDFFLLLKKKQKQTVKKYIHKYNVNVTCNILPQK